MRARLLDSILARHWQAFALVIVFSMCFNALMLTAPLYMLSIFSNVLTSKNVDTLWMLSIAAAVALTLQALIDFFRSRLMVRAGIAVDSALALPVIEAVVARSGTRLQADQRLLNDASELRRFVTDAGLMTLIDLPFVPLYLTVIAWLHPLLAMVALGGAILVVLIAALGDWLVRRPLDEAVSSRHRGRALIDEVLRNGDVVRSMGMMPALSLRLRRVGRESLHWLGRGADRAAALRSSARAVRIALQLSLYCAGAWLFVNDELMVGAIVAASVLMNRVLSPVEAAIPAWRGLARARQALNRLEPVLVVQQGEPDFSPRGEPARSPRFEARRATVRSPENGRVLVNGVTLALRPGELFGIAGPCGSGKSALGRMLAGVHAPDAGSIWLNGRSYRDWLPFERSTLVGFCPQEPQLFAGTIDENIARFSEGQDVRQGVVRVTQPLGLDSLVSVLPEAYSTRLGVGGTPLSSGMRQQVSLARAFYGDPRLIVLDEPAAWLDRGAQQKLLSTIEAARERGTTVVVISHQPSLMRSADRIAVMNSGGIESLGPGPKMLAHLTSRSDAAATTSAVPIVSGVRS